MLGSVLAAAAAGEVVAPFHLFQIVDLEEELEGGLHVVRLRITHTVERTSFRRSYR